jgi:hypothetical protein
MLHAAPASRVPGHSLFVGMCSRCTKSCSYCPVQHCCASSPVTTLYACAAQLLTTPLPALDRYIEAKLKLSQYAPWTFVSCDRAMRVGGACWERCAVMPCGASGRSRQPVHSSCVFCTCCHTCSAPCTCMLCVVGVMTRQVLELRPSRSNWGLRHNETTRFERLATDPPHPAHRISITHAGARATYPYCALPHL